MIWTTLMLMVKQSGSGYAFSSYGLDSWSDFLTGSSSVICPYSYHTCRLGHPFGSSGLGYDSDHDDDHGHDPDDDPVTTT